jgi:hypothetical protein
MFTTPDGVELYTKEDYQTATSGQFTLGLATGKDTALFTARNAVISVMKSQVKEGSMDSENAIELTNLILAEMGVETVEHLHRTFSVVVYINNEAVLHLDSVEAEDEDDAEAKVNDEIDFEDIELSFTISSQGESSGASIGDDSYRIDIAGMLSDLVKIEVEENDN